MVKLKLQYFGHLMWTDDSLEKSLILGKIEGWRRGRYQRMKWLDSITDPMTWTWANSGRCWSTGRPGELQSMGSQRAGHDWATEQQPPPPRCLVSHQCDVNVKAFHGSNTEMHRLWVKRVILHNVSRGSSSQWEDFRGNRPRSLRKREFCLPATFTQLPGSPASWFTGRCGICQPSQPREPVP